MMEASRPRPPDGAALAAGTLDVLRDQETLEPLRRDGDNLVAAHSGHRHPIAGGLVFMGFDSEDPDVQRLAESEREWQGTTATVERDAEFLRTSAPAAVEALNLARRVRGLRAGMRALDVGSGAGWGSWLLAEAGYDTWLVDFEANSLSLGWVYDHPGLGPGKRIVADATLLPFADGAFDIVLSKQFIHHIADKRRALAEMNRVLRPGGTLVLLEPTRSLWTSLAEIRHPDEHEGHVIVWPRQYFAALRNAGFALDWRGAQFSGGGGRIPLTARIKRRADRRIGLGQSSWDPLTRAYVNLIGGGATLVVLAVKERTVPAARRPHVTPVSPDTLRIGPDDRAVHERLAALVRDAARRLDHDPSAVAGNQGFSGR